jgi:peptidoglycan/LPS O-acetylase OafA/YrhL
MNPKTTPRVYRPDIDGLRAAAVLAVLGYHYFPRNFPGGFVGVDVFFVISGFLICGIILDDLQSATFSLWNFYSRRIRRIFPALIVVLAALLVFGWFALFPDEYRALGKHVFGGSAFISNFLLWREAGYFDVVAKAKPLLHLWSLGIEEQFYIVFPLLLWGCAKKHFRIVAVIIALYLASFMENMHRLPNPVLNFYSPLARAWELLAGALLCKLMRHPLSTELGRKLDIFAGKIIYENERENDSRNLGLFLALLGVILLIAALLIARDNRPYPGWYALLPVSGAMFLIAAPSNPISGRLLANRPAVFIGRISYPLYLWHWALISCAFILNGGLDTGSWSTWLPRAGLAAASFALAALTYVLVEKPIRFGAWARKGKIYALIFAMATVGLAGLYIYARDGLPERGIGSMDYPQDYRANVPFFDEACQAYTGISEAEFSDVPFLCRLSSGHGPATVALIGNSFAWSASYGVEKFNSLRGLNTLLLARGTLPLLLGTEALVENDDKKDKYRDLLFCAFDVLKREEIKFVFIIIMAQPLMETNASKYLQPTIDKLNELGKTVFLVEAWPTLPRRGMDYVVRPYSGFSKSQVYAERQLELDRNQLLKNGMYWLEYFQLLRSMKKATIIDGTWDAFCPGSKCRVFSGKGQFLYYDNRHLTYAGSEFLVEKVLAPYLAELAGF